jgi:hypothetical protein
MWQRLYSWRAASMPLMPGMRMSRKAMSGWWRAAISTASMPLAASPTISQFGPHLCQARAQLVAHRRFVVGDQGGHGLCCVLHHLVGSPILYGTGSAQAPPPGGASITSSGLAAVQQRRRSRMFARPTPSSACRSMPTPSSLHVDVQGRRRPGRARDGAAFDLRLQAVLDRVLDQVCSIIGGKGALPRKSGMSKRTFSLSFMRACMMAR